MVKLSAFADEVTDDFAGQVEFLVSQNIGAIEIRFVNRKNIMDLNKTELGEAKRLLDDNGIGISAIGSPIGKVRLDESFEDHFDRFKQAIDLAGYFQSPLIRIFSYYPPEGKCIDDYREEVLYRTERKTRVAEKTNITLVLENEAHVFGHSAKNSADLVKTINSPNLRLAYDPANFVWGENITNNVELCWPLMMPYVVHVHIKDWKIGSKGVGSMPGEGDGQIKSLIKKLVDIQYSGFLTMEPHLKLGGQFGGDTGPELFAQAISATIRICNDVGLSWIVIKVVLK